MTSSQPVNAANVRAAMAQKGLSERELSKQSNLGQTSIRSAIHHGFVHSSISLGRVRTYIDTLGLSWGDLLDDPTPEIPITELDLNQRQKTLARLVTASDRAIDLDDLCIVFGITLTELRMDLDALAGPLGVLGFHLVVGHNHAVLLVRGTDPHAVEAEARLAELRDARQDLNISAARTLFKAYQGTLSRRRLSNNDQVQVGLLRQRGAIAPPTSGSGTVLSEATRYSLMLE